MMEQAVRRVGVTECVEQIGDATLYLGDCRKILPTLGGVECIVTDPPYGIAHLQLGSRKGGAWQRRND